MAGTTRFQFTKIRVADVEKEYAFYSAALGRVERSRYAVEEGEGALEEILMTSTDGTEQTLVLLHYRHQPVPPTGSVVLGFLVTGIDDVVRRAEAAGGRVTTEPYDMPELNIRVAFVEDPEGHLVEFFERV
ncbi:VOC family protein [Trebonia kvetii]|uniref:VOC family protein n=1 Tax=Trebonia kvetii TaxID=2480626 RepID=UPI001652A7AD|nr:VOC family protein [Trebonia kvetii]